MINTVSIICWPSEHGGLRRDRCRREMPGQYAIRGGILDVYSPEAERPVRIEFFGDEVDSIRRFDPASQRSSNPLDEALLLPLTETPVSDHLLGAIHPRSPANASPEPRTRS